MLGARAGSLFKGNCYVTFQCVDLLLERVSEVASSEMLVLIPNKNVFSKRVKDQSILSSPYLVKIRKV